MAVCGRSVTRAPRPPVGSFDDPAGGHGKRQRGNPTGGDLAPRLAGDPVQRDGAAGRLGRHRDHGPFAQPCLHRRRVGGGYDRSRILAAKPLTRLFKINLDNFIRTLAVISSMALFMDSSAAAGKVVLVANAVLLNLQTFVPSLDDFAHATESRIGRAIGARTGAVGSVGPQQLGDGAGAWPDLFRRRWLDRRRAHHS